ncbi:MAG: nucleotidyltransferase family protein [Betaproteobacteria bacterium]
MPIVGLLLAAGRGERFGGAKLLAPLPASGADAGVPVGVAACRALVAAIADVVAVVRPGDIAIAALFAAAGARVVECARADDGMGASLACGVNATRDADGWIVALADMPWIAPATLAAVRSALEAGATVVAPFHRGERGHPVGFGRACGAELAALTGDEGAKSVVAARRAVLVRIDVDDAGILHDVDTPVDLVPGCG